MRPFGELRGVLERAEGEDILFALEERLAVLPGAGLPVPPADGMPLEVGAFTLRDQAGFGLRLVGGGNAQAEPGVKLPEFLAAQAGVLIVVDAGQIGFGVRIRPVFPVGDFFRREAHKS